MDTTLLVRPNQFRREASHTVHAISCHAPEVGSHKNVNRCGGHVDEMMN